MNTFELSLDLDKRSTLQGITIRRGDSDGTTVRASIFDHGSVANLTGATAYLVIRLPDGEHYYRKAATVGTGIVTTTINEAEAASAVGSTKLAYFEISQGGSEYSTSSFAVKVLNDAVAGMNPPESYDDEIAQLVDDWLVAHPEATTTVQDGSITTAKIANANVTTAKVADGAITTTKVADSNITTAKIANANVTTVKVADGAITHDKLAEGVTNVIDSVPTIQRNVDRLLGNVLIGELAEGTVLTADDAYSAPPKSVGVYGASTQNGTPTPDAPVAIQSVDDLTLYVCGFNVWDEQWERGYINDTTGENVGTSAQYVRTKNHIPVVSGMAYNFTCTSAIRAGKVYYYDANKAYLSFENVTFGAGADKTPPANAHYMRFWLNHPETYSNDICINVSDTSRNGTYAPYNGASVSIPFSNHIARSLPDGTEDELTLSYIGPSETEGWGVFSAELVQRVSYVDDVTTLNVNGFNGSGASPYITFSISIASNRGINSTTVNTMATAHQGRILSSYNSPCIYVTGNGGSLLIGDSRFSGLSQSDAAELLQGESVQYTLATPITHDLGTVELPVNPVPDLTAWADGGSAQPNMSMEYERDVNIALVMERDKAIAEIAPLETSPTKANHSVGTYLMYDGTLYKVTRAVASGEQITPGTNVTATTVAAELLALA